MENLSRCHREKSGKRLLPHSTYILQHKNDIVKNNKYAETVVFCFIKPKKRKINNSVCRKSMFFKKSACPQSLSPLGHSVGFASCKAWCVLISASLPKTPFPGERLCMLCWLCIVQSLWAYTPGIRAGAECGAAALTKQGRLQSVAHSRCTMQRHQRLTTRIVATPQTLFLNCIGLSTACKLSCFSAFLPLCLSSLFRFLRHILKQ